MPFLQRATANYFGAMPIDGIQSMNVYLVSSSATTGASTIDIGDVVCFSTLADGAVVVRRTTGGTSTDAGVYAGVAASRVVGLEGSTSADFRVHSSQTVLLYDGPDQKFVICDTTSGVIGTSTGAVGIGKSYAVVSTGATGSTGPGPANRSVMALSGVTASSGSANGYRFKVIGLHPIEKAYSTELSGAAAAAAQVRKWIVVPALPMINRRDTGVITT